MIDAFQALPTAATAFLASLVEAVEAATIVLAAGAIRGWRSSLAGAGAALLALAALVAAFGKSIAAVPLPLLQLVVGTLLLLFGLRWLRKAMLRAAGVIALRDEGALYDLERGALTLAGAVRPHAWDAIAAITAFKAVFLEGVEVIVIVIGIGAAGGQLAAASEGALAACVLVATAALMLRAPLSRVPENTLKFAVGVMVSAFGMFWFGEGIGLAWPWEDATIVALMAALLLAALAGVARGAAHEARMNAHLEAIAALFYDDGRFALAQVAVLAVTAIGSALALPHAVGSATAFFVIAVPAVLVDNVLRTARAHANPARNAVS